MSIKGKEVKITWIDAKMWGSAWLDNDIESFELPISRSRGLVAKETDEMILLLQSDTNDGLKANLIGIPKGCIKGIKELK